MINKPLKEFAPGKNGRWLVLIVDDEQEIHDVTRMLLSSTIFCGGRINLHSAYTAEHAKAFLRKHPETALILLDVVMETDHAGLHLIHYIRNELNNQDIQIVLRTGQPGQAPEHDVILNYDINGYFLKTELTSQKLHSIVVTALRTYSYIKSLKTYCPLPLSAGRMIDVTAQQRDAIIRSLEAAIAGTEPSCLYAQPQMDLKSGTVVGVELLLHWQTAAGAILKSEAIMDIAEQADLSIRVTEWLLNQACLLGRTWQAKGLSDLRVAMNVMPQQLQHIPPMLKRCLEHTDLPANFLDLEIPESALMQMSPSTMDIMRQLQTFGVAITVDHFGTGLTALAQLRQLHPARLKIDRQFVYGVASDPDSATLTRSIIALAHTLGISVVAEGVSTKEQFEFLKWEDCEAGQGEFLGEAVPYAQLSTWEFPTPSD